MLTNEEKRVPIYTATSEPTVAATVTPDIPLATLNLNWTEKDLPQRERTRHVHGLHPYLGKFVPQLVEVFLRKFFSPGDTVLDPFAGSGTTLVQANELGIHSIGYDISAFNVLLCRVKTAVYDLPRLRREALDVLEKTRLSISQGRGQLSLWDEQGDKADIDQVENEYLQNWYAPQALMELLTYKKHIEEGDYRYKDFLRIILTRSARSARLTTHFDLDFPKQPQREPYWCYKHSRTCSPTEEAFKFLKRYTMDALRRVEAFAEVRTKARVTVHHGDSRQVEIGPVDGVITSPPYVGLIDYHEQHAYAYHLLGLSDNRQREIGPAANGAGQKARQQYQQDIAHVFRNATKNLPQGGVVIVVAGDRHNLYPEIARLSGLEEDAVLQRHVNRRTGRRSSEFYESVFIWRKP